MSARPNNVNFSLPSPQNRFSCQWEARAGHAPKEQSAHCPPKSRKTQKLTRTQAQKGITATHAPHGKISSPSSSSHRVKKKAAHGREKVRGHRAPWLKREERRGHWTEGMLPRTAFPASLSLALKAKQTAPQDRNVLFFTSLKGVMRDLGTELRGRSRGVVGRRNSCVSSPPYCTRDVNALQTDTPLHLDVGSLSQENKQRVYDTSISYDVPQGEKIP